METIALLIIEIGLFFIGVMIGVYFGYLAGQKDRSLETGGA